MKFDTKFDCGNIIRVISCTRKNLHSECPKCLGFGDVRIDITDEKGKHRFEIKTCKECDGVGKIKRNVMASDWELIPYNFIVTGISLNIRDGTVKNEIILCKKYTNDIAQCKKNAEDKTVPEQAFPAEDCFDTIEEAEKEIRIRNFRKAVLVRFAGNTYVFDKIEHAEEFIQFFIKNTFNGFDNAKIILGKEFPTIPRRFMDLLQLSVEHGINIKVTEMRTIEMENLPRYGGLRVIQDNDQIPPNFVDVLFTTEDLAKKHEETKEKNTKC